MMRFFSFLAAFAMSTWASLRGYKTLVSPELQKVRYRRCKRCICYQEGICTQCGCLIEAKILLATEKCPLGKWRRVWVKNNPSKRP